MPNPLEQIQLWAEELGATGARVVTDRDRLIPQQAVREDCLRNACGRSGTCWTCPPYVGELAELGARLASYPEVVVVQTIATLEDSWDFEAATAAMVTHNDRMRELGRRVQAAFPDCAGLVLGAGGCGFCPTCTCPDEPCRHPEESLASVESHGLDVKALVESVGLKYVNGKGTVSYVGAVLIRCPR
jgi:predicted metal-binding protein